VTRQSLVSELLSVPLGTVHSRHCAGDGQSHSSCFGREGIMLQCYFALLENVNIGEQIPFLKMNSCIRFQSHDVESPLGENICLKMQRVKRMDSRLDHLVCF